LQPTQTQLGCLDKLSLRDNSDVFKATHNLAIPVQGSFKYSVKHVQRLGNGLVAIGVKDELPACFKEWYKEPKELLTTLVV